MQDRTQAVPLGCVAAAPIEVLTGRPARLSRIRRIRNHSAPHAGVQRPAFGLFKDICEFIPPKPALAFREARYQKGCDRTIELLEDWCRNLAVIEIAVVDRKCHGSFERLSMQKFLKKVR